MYDAIYKACHDKLIKDKSDKPVRRAIVIVSDGNDNQSEISRAQAIEMAQRAEVIFTPSQPMTAGSSCVETRFCNSLADATGGRAFFPSR